MRELHTADDETPYVSFADITEIELIILKRMREVTIGDHRSRSHGSGFDFLGLRDWQAGDRPSAIDWPQSTITNFSPLIVREFEQPSVATVMAVADTSLSTRCGTNGTPIAAAVARAIATVGLSASFFQDPFGLVTFDAGFQHLSTIRPRTGKGHLVHCLDAYQFQRGLQSVKRTGGIGDTLSGFLRSRTLLPVISDFLFDDPAPVLHDLALLNAVHDVFLVLIDSAFAFSLPPVSAGWIDVADVETGRTRTVSRRAFQRLGDQAREWQNEVRRIAKDAAIDIVEVGLDLAKSDIALNEFVAERRLRKTYS
ncbi:MAG TPA: DUF58 domain-containing protein [Vicinamibacterales bacterium]|jgi:uncharacterized protein (DUF58 family)|nr:DUF58 domain-containing protein [Vicinamibacterales bacterium]